MKFIVDGLSNKSSESGIFGFVGNSGCAYFGNVFITQGFATMNNITKPVMVKYIPLPAGTNQDGNFNLYMTIQFNARDFNRYTLYSNSQIIIKISDATVNRV